MPDNKRNLLLGVCGSIAAYRTPDLAASLRRSDSGFEVRTILSQAAGRFVTPEAVECMSRGKVYTNDDALSGWQPTHIELATWADKALIAPATAATIGKLAHGIAEGLLLETFLALPPDVPRFIAPAMNTHMLHQRSVERNLAQLEEDGFTIIDARVGELACGAQGYGKVASIAEIVQKTQEASN